MSTTTGKPLRTKAGYLNLAADFAATAWFPGLPGVAERAITTLDRFGNRSEFHAIIRADISLVTLTALELYRAQSSATEAFDGEPLEIIRRADPTVLRDILERAVQQAAPNVATFSADQHSRLRHALVAASAAEVLAPSFGAGQDAAYACALFRQLGAILIAWNYPQVYRRALSLVRLETSLDEIITKILGYSPLTLGLTIAQRRNVPPEILRGMGDQTIYTRARSGALASGDRLKELCTLGETVAETFDPMMFPGTARRATAIRATFENHAGRSALTQLAATMRTNARIYLELIPPVFALPDDIAAEADIPSGPIDTETHLSNPFVARCPEHIREIFRDAYAKLLGGGTDSNVQLIFQSLVMTLGFKSGCVYLFDSRVELLRARYSAGDRRPIDYRPVPVANASDDPVAAVFARPHDRAPFIDGSTMFGVLGEARPSGALRLVLGPELRRLPPPEIELLFNALRRTVEDCVGANG